MYRKMSLAKAKEVASQTWQLQESQQEKMKIQSGELSDFCLILTQCSVYKKLELIFIF